jgi:hypothetical protein
MDLWKDKAWIILGSSDCDDMDKCRIVFDHSTCSYGQPAVLLERPACGLPAGTPIGPGDARGALIQHLGPHKAALEDAGWQVVEALNPATD